LGYFPAVVGLAKAQWVPVAILAVSNRPGREGRLPAPLPMTLTPMAGHPASADFGCALRGVRPVVQTPSRDSASPAVGRHSV